ncbi:MAG: ABC-2 family transporter protein [candidate division Zixibacteria bacterium]|nr:ABC-2 family transporter protein [candidate division Zixibacteria bacterium]
MKYLRIFTISIREQIAYLPVMLLRNIFFIIIFYIFYSLWSAIYQDRETIEGFTIIQMIWYLTFAEAIELSRCGVMNQIQEEIKDGSVVYGLARPYYYVIFKISRGMGESMVRCLPVLILGYAFAYIFVGPLDGYFTALPFALILLIGGLLLNVLWQINIGLLSFWFEEVGPFYWILTKMVFIMGGLFFPIDLFPGWLAGIAKYLPFAFSAYWPARTMVQFNQDIFLTGFLGLIIYASGLLLCSTVIFEIARKRVHVQGG